MSRFLDAMRDRGKPGPDGHEPRAYRGSVVDASAVLGEEQLTLVDEDARPSASNRHNAVDHGSASDRSGGRPGTGSADWSDRVATANTQPPRYHSPAPSNEDRNNQMHRPAADDGGVYEPAIPPAYREPRGFRSRFDPLFYLIIGIAAAGLFLCLYALITQNDAYFEREYQQLQRESAALQARLAASAELQADLLAANQNVLVNSAPAEAVVVDQPEEAVDSQATANAIEVATEPEINAAVQNASPEGVAAVEVIDAITESQTQTAVDVAEESVEDAIDPALVLLQQEVDALRDTLSRQEQIISRLERDNRELNTNRQSTQNTGSDATPAAEPVSKPQPEVVTATAVLPEENPVADQVTTESPAIVSSGVSQVTTSLASPLQNASEEVSDLISQGYLAYQSKDYNAAADYYGKALEFDPYNRDANLGVAAIAQLNGDNRLAEDRYRHLLTLDPADEVAFSALLNLSGAGGQGSIIEFELLQHAENIRQVPSLYAILGNYYSRQKRWLKASELYAIALDRGAANPDYLFNYAVSLDNEGRSGQAAEYYSQALNAMQEEPFSFDTEAARQRLESLTTTK